MAAHLLKHAQRAFQLDLPTAEDLEKLPQAKDIERAAEKKLGRKLRSVSIDLEKSLLEQQETLARLQRQLAIEY